MAYQAGSYASQHDLLDKLRLFCVAAGWTQNMWQDDFTVYSGPPSTSGKRLHLQRGSQFVNMRSGQAAHVAGAGYMAVPLTGIGVNGSSGFSAGAAWDLQPGAPTFQAGASVGVAIGGVSAAGNHRFFSDGSGNVLAAVEWQPGKCQFIAFGTMIRLGNWTGGAYVACSASLHESSVIRAPFLGCQNSDMPNAFVLVNGVWHSGAQGSNPIRAPGLARWPTSGLGASAEKLAVNYPLEAASPSALTDSTPMLPLLVSVDRGGGFFSPIGYVPSARSFNVTNYDLGAELIYGPDTWQLFPAPAKDDASSGNLGLAVLKVS